VLNAAARVITGTWKFDHGLGQILHEKLHWLHIPDRVLFKLAVTVHRCLKGRAPPYLSAYCIPAASFNTRQHLHSTNRQLLAVPRYQFNTYGHRAFSVAGPSLELSQISSETRPSVQTLSDVCLKRTCLLDTSAFSALKVLDNNRTLNLLTYLLPFSFIPFFFSSLSLSSPSSSFPFLPFPSHPCLFIISLPSLPSFFHSHPRPHLPRWSR